MGKTNIDNIKTITRKFAVASIKTKKIVMGFANMEIAGLVCCMN
jgi:hypothetical protein